MNKLLLVTTLLFATLSGYLYYKLFHPPAPAKICPVSYDYHDGDSVGIVNYKTASDLFNNYKSDLKKSKIASTDSSVTGKFIEQTDDSKSVWFPLDRLKNFLWHVENQNCSNNCNDTLGLRIYFAKYPDLKNTHYTGLEDVPAEYSNHQTLFMVPTYRGKDGHNYDFYPGGKDCRTPLASSPTHLDGTDLNLVIHDPSPYIFLFDLYTPGQSTNSQNHGGLIPPGDPTGASFN